MNEPGQDEGNKGLFARFISHPIVVTVGLVGAVPASLVFP